MGNILSNPIRRSWLCRNTPSCPTCREKHQIQLLYYIGCDAQWKCRICKHKWIYEPRHRSFKDIK